MTAILNHITKGERFTVKKRAKIAREYFGKDDSKRKEEKSSKKKINRGEPTESLDEDIVFVYKNELVQGVIDKEQFGKYGLVHTEQELFGSNVADFEQQRKKLLDVCQACGKEVHMQFVGSEEEQIDSADMQVEIEKSILRNGDSAIALLDAMMRNKLNSCSSAVGHCHTFMKVQLKPLASWNEESNV